MTIRRCVICGKRPPIRDAQGNRGFAYPKNEEEAQIWKTSMAATDCSVASIQKECCVCVEHIPDFVSRAKAIGNEEKKRQEATAAAKDSATEDGTSTGTEAAKKTATEAGTEAATEAKAGEPAAEKEKTSVSVLLLNGSSLPTYCAKGKCSAFVESRPAEKGDSKSIVTKRIQTKGSDTEIFVLESGFQDAGGKFPDIDGTEVTLLRAPTQDEDELERLQEELMGEEEEDEDPNVRRRRGYCMPGCTDVLLLGRGQHESDVCPCKCEECRKLYGQPSAETCCKLECCERCEPEYFTHPPCGCECEQMVRRKLGRVIKTQAQRICELENLLCRQNSMRNCLQRKLDDLYCEFGRLDDAEKESHRSGVSCPGSVRGGPDCASVLSARPETQPPPPPEVPPTKSRSGLKRRPKKQISISKISQPILPEVKSLEVPERVHGFADMRRVEGETPKRTKRPQWVNRAKSNMMSDSSIFSIKFDKLPTVSRVVNYSHSTLMSQSRSAASPAPSRQSVATKASSKSNLSRSIHSDMTKSISKSYRSLSTSNRSQA